MSETAAAAASRWNKKKMIQFETVKYGILKAKDNQSSKGEHVAASARFLLFYGTRILKSKKKTQLKTQIET